MHKPSSMEVVIFQLLYCVAGTDEKNDSKFISDIYSVSSCELFVFYQLEQLEKMTVSPWQYVCVRRCYLFTFCASWDNWKK